MPREGSVRRSAVRRFFGTPKGLLIILLTFLCGLAAVSDGAARVGPGLLSAVVAAVLVDLPILRARTGRWEVPSGAILTGQLVAMVLSPYSLGTCPTLRRSIAIASKYVVRTRSANVFNPAGASAWWRPSICSIPDRAGGGRCPSAWPIALAAVVLTGDLHRRPRQQAADGAGVSRSSISCSSPSARSSERPGRSPRSSARPMLQAVALLRLLHPDRPADVAGEVSAADGVRRDRRGGELRGVHMDRRGVLPAGRRARGQCVRGGVQAEGRPAPSHRPEDVAGTGVGARHRGLT